LLFARFCERSFGGMPQAGGVRRYYKKMKNTNISVKKHQTYWVLLLTLLVSGSIQAKVTNWLGGYAQVGEWTLLPKESEFGPSFGGVGGLGFLYEMQAGGTYSPTRFLLNFGVGAQGGMTSFSQSSNMTATLMNQTDLDGDNFNYVYELTDRHDRYTNVAVQIPLMIGVQHRKFYMLAGAKVGANMWTKTHSTALLTTYGVYQQFDEHRSMPEYQFFDNMPISGGVRTSLKLDVDLSVEIGGRLGMVTSAVGYDVPKRKVEYRLAAFMDYGLMDIHYHRDQLPLGTYNPANRSQILPIEGNLSYNSGSTYPVYKTTSMVDNLVMNDIMSVSNFASSVNNLVIGLKFTILFQLPEPAHCVLCQDAYRSSARSYGGSRGLQYEE